MIIVRKFGKYKKYFIYNCIIYILVNFVFLYFNYFKFCSKLFYYLNVDGKKIIK